VRAELRVDHVALSFGWGISYIDVLDSNSTGNRNRGFIPALSLRWFRGDGEGFFVAASYLYRSYARRYDCDSCYDRTALLQTATLVIGQRWRHRSGLYLEAGIGGGIYILQDHASLRATIPTRDRSSET
jgi:hypothetical protein